MAAHAPAQANPQAHLHAGVLALPAGDGVVHLGLHVQALRSGRTLRSASQMLAMRASNPDWTVFQSAHCLVPGGEQAEYCCAMGRAARQQHVRRLGSSKTIQRPRPAQPFPCNSAGSRSDSPECACYISISFVAAMQDTHVRALQLAGPDERRAGARDRVHRALWRVIPYLQRGGKNARRNHLIAVDLCALPGEETARRAAAGDSRANLLQLPLLWEPADRCIKRRPAAPHWQQQEGRGAAG